MALLPLIRNKKDSARVKIYLERNLEKIIKANSKGDNSYLNMLAFIIIAILQDLTEGYKNNRLDKDIKILKDKF